MSSLKEEELINILPKDGPTVEEVKKYLEKYNDEFIKGLRDTTKETIEVV